MKTSEVIKAAYKLICKPENWTQGTFARDAEGNRVSARNPTAVCFCAAGAVQRASAAGERAMTYVSYPSVWNLLTEDAVVHGHRDVPDANDHSTHDAVLRALRRVYREAKRLESEGKM